jgi:prevent-host-death family protein
VDLRWVRARDLAILLKQTKCGYVTTFSEIDMITTLSGRELNQDLGRAKRAAKDGPVIITDRGRPVHVLLSFDEYKRLTGRTRSLADMLAAPEAGDLDLPLPNRTEHAHPVDLS